MSKLGDQPAFPVPSDFIPDPRPDRNGFINTAEYGAQPIPGMTYRQWLVGMALQGTLANPNTTDMNEKAIANEAVACADATIAAQEQRAAAYPLLLEACKAILRAPSVGSSGPGSVTLEVQSYRLEEVRAAVAAAEKAPC